MKLQARISFVLWVVALMIVVVFVTGYMDPFDRYLWGVETEKEAVIGAAKRENSKIPSGKSLPEDEETPLDAPDAEAEAEASGGGYGGYGMPGMGGMGGGYGMRGGMPGMYGGRGGGAGAVMGMGMGAYSSLTETEKEILETYRGTQDEGKRKLLVQRLTREVEDQFEQRQSQRGAELKQLREQLERLEAIHERREKERDRIVTDRVDQLIRDIDGLGWGSPVDGAQHGGPGF